MKYRFLIFILSAFLLPISSNAQHWWHGSGGGHGGGSGSDYLQFNKTSSWDFSCSSVSDLENDQTISNAFYLKIRSKHSNCSVYVKLSSYSTPSGVSSTSCPIQVCYRSTTSSSAYNVVTSPLTVTTSDQKLFNQRSTSGSHTYNFYYDLKLKALGYDYVPGNYNYTLTFTMTQP